MRYCICKNGFEIDKYDDDGFSTGRCMNIKKGTKFCLSDDKYRIIGGSDTVRLDSEGGIWLEISPDTLNKYFEEVIEQEASE